MISHGLRLAAMSTLESPEVVEAFGKVMECAVARGKAQAVEELHESYLLTVPLATRDGKSTQNRRGKPKPEPVGSGSGAGWRVWMWVWVLI